MLVQFCRKHGISISPKIGRNAPTKEIAANPELAERFITLLIDQNMKMQEEQNEADTLASTYHATLFSLLNGRYPSDYDISKMPEGLRETLSESEFAQSLKGGE